jgi:methyl-accepting chemotaxis protein
MAESRQRLAEQQAEAAAAANASSLSRRASQMPPPASEASDGALSMSAPVTLNDRQHRTAAALLASLSQTAARGKERLARLERVLNTIAADASEPERVRRLHHAHISA